MGDELSAMTDDRDAMDALLDKNTSHMKTLIAILAAQGGAINYQASELEELQDILRGYEESANAPWLYRLSGLIGELLG